MSLAARAGRVVVVSVVALVAAVAGYLLFLELPNGDLARLLGVVLLVGVVATGFRVGARLAGSLFPGYNVAEVGVEAPITRDGGQPSIPTGPGTPGAGDIVEQVERADDDSGVEALLVRLNTPGGEPVASEDIRRAVADFDGPVVGYAVDVCASGGYMIAAGCDEVWAREGSVVGSIGVRGSRFTATDLLDKLGVDYQQFTAGEYKEAGVPFADLDEDERAYLQGIVDDYYEQFVAAVVEGRDLDAETVRETEAKVYLGEAALELGLVDHLGDDGDVESRVGDLIDAEPRVARFEPQVGLAERLRGGAATVAYALGAGLASQFDDDADLRFRF